MIELQDLNKKDQLTATFLEAQEKKAAFVGVKMTLLNVPGPEYIINPNENIEGKLEYYRTIYNDDLAMEKLPAIRILGWAYGDTAEEVYQKLS